MLKIGFRGEYVSYPFVDLTENIILIISSTFYNFAVISILLTNTKKSLKLVPRNSCFFLLMMFIIFFVLNNFFVFEAVIVLNLPVNFEQKWPSCSYKIVVIKKGCNSANLILLNPLTFILNLYCCPTDDYFATKYDK